MIPVIEEKRYMLSFDFQSSNGKEAGYYLGFNDPEKTVIKEKVSVKNSEWQNYVKKINAPHGASAVSLVVYSYEDDGENEILTRYDNFNFIELPDLEDKYILVSIPEDEFIEPASIDFELISSYKKKVHVKSASTSFYLVMSESYHDQWKLEMNNEKITGFFASWIPWVEPDRVEDDKHFELNGFLNGWFVETGELCRDNDACTQNADGTYDMEMVIEFFPQRWFYLGLLISGTTFTSCLGYLVWAFVKRRRLKVKNIIKTGEV